MNNLYLLYTVFEPNTAPTNRILGYLKSLSILGIPTKMVFISPDSKFSKYPEKFEGVEFIYLWEWLPIRNRYIKQVLFSINVCKFSKILKKGDKVVLLDMSRAIFPLVNLRKRGIKVFHEKTEHPYAYKVRTVNVERYLKACRELDGLFVISTALKYYYISKGIEPSKIHIINMFADTSRFENLSKTSVEERYIAYCGTASHSKDGVDELIKAFAIFHKTIPDVKLWIIGKIPSREEDMENLHLIDSLGLNDFVVLKGVINSQEMPQVLKNAEVLALDRPDSLQAKHGFPTKLGEYLLTGNPVVLTDVGDITLFLKDKESAMIAKDRNPEDFASKLIWLYQNREKAVEIGLAGCQVALNQFNALTETKIMLKVI